jgi:hypothetical protein
VRVYCRTLVFLTAGIAIAGCTLLHHRDSPQQQFFAAVQRGNSAQASQIWLHMDADDRANFAHGVGFKPLVPPAELKAELARKQQAAEADAATVDGGDFAGRQTIEYPGLDTDLHAGSLENLPNLVTPPAPATPPIP